MYDWLLIVVPAVLAFPVIAIVALVVGLGQSSAIRSLQSRIAALERLAAALAAPGRGEPPEPIAAATPPRPPTPPAAEPPRQPSPQPPPPPAAAVPSVPAVAPAPTRAVGFEEEFGTRWVVWVGGIALALGGIFLVRYTIQQGLIGPGVRIVLSLLLASALVAAGEWARRSERGLGLPALPLADIPSILTAAGTTVAYATVYAAYALYGFVPPAAAFILLGVVALLTLAAALLHGPALAGLGVVGAFLAPALVSAETPDYWALYIYVAIVTAAALALARFRLWAWLAMTAIVLGALWTSPGTEAYPVEALGAHVFNVLAGYVLAAVFVVCGLWYGPPAKPGEVDLVSTAALSIYFVIAAFLTLASQHDLTAFSAFAALTVATVAIAWRAEAAAGAVPIAAASAVAVTADWAVQLNVSKLLAPAGALAPAFGEPQRYDYDSHLALAAAWAAMFGISGFLAQGRSVRPLVPLLWSATAALAPIGLLIASYYRVAELDRSLPFAGFALLLAALYAVATETLVQRPPRPGVAASSAIFATAALTALALALTFALEKGWLTIALALIAPAAAWVEQKRPLPWLRWIAAIVVALVIGRIGHEPRIVGDDLGTTPIFNWLLYGYGAPALSFWVAGWMLRRRIDDLPARVVDAGAILFTVLLLVFEIRHFATGGNIYRPTAGFTEAAMDVNAGLALTIGLERIRGRTGSIVHDIGALVLAALTLCAIVVELMSFVSWDFYYTRIDGVFFNTILLGYGLPAGLAIALALTARTTRPLPYRIVAVITAVTLALFYLTLEVRRLFHGPMLAGPTGDAEQFSYSAAWLVFGVALLAAGFLLRSAPARFVSLAVVAITIAKVFIIDTASIGGIYRALSAIGLGVVLLGIGWLYQRLLYPRPPAIAVAGSE